MEQGFIVCCSVNSMIIQQTSEIFATEELAIAYIADTAPGGTAYFVTEVSSKPVDEQE